MSGCSVLGCESKQKRKYADVSFHQFPKDEDTRKKWAAATGRKNWAPNQFSRICSIHFDGDCFHRCQRISFIKKFAVPTLFVYNPSRNDSSVFVNNMNNDDDLLNVSSPVENKYDLSFDEDIKPESNTDKPTNLEIPYPGNSYVVLTTMLTERPESIEDGIKMKGNGSTNLKVCRVCLAVGCKMFRLNGRLYQAYTQVTGIPVSSHDGLPQLLCWECASRVLSAARLRDRATKAHNILSALHALGGSINMQDIRSVDRGQMKLMTSLKCDFFKDKQHHNIIDIIEVKKSYKSNDNTEIDENTQAFRNEFDDNYDEEKYKNEDDDKEKYENKDNGDNKYKSDIDEDDDDDDNFKSQGDQEIDKKDQKTEKDSTTKNVESLNGFRCHKKSSISKLKEFFTVTVVKLEDAIAAAQSRRQSEAHIDAPYKCEVCFRGYYHNKRYESHVIKHTEKFGNIECPVCKLRYKSTRVLCNHTLAQHRREYSCKQCDFVTGSRIRAGNHRQVHAGALFQCPHCPKLLNQKTSYYSHLRIKHACSFTCELCGHTFLSAFGVRQHKRKQHKHDDLSIEGPFCETCDMTFATREAYDTHLLMSSRHNNDSRLSKVNSYETSHRKDARGRRQRQKPTKQPVTCEKCGVTLDSRYSYALHFRNVHPGETRTQQLKSAANPTVCDQCGKTFSCLARLTAHMPVHTGERFNCDHCGKTFTGKFNLYMHLKIHEPSRPTYPCELCGKRFHFSGNLKRHMLLHENATAFECEACGKRLTTRAGLQAHIDHVHSGRPWPKRLRLRRRPTDTKTHRQPPQTQQQSKD